MAWRTTLSALKGVKGGVAHLAVGQELTAVHLHDAPHVIAWWCGCSSGKVRVRRPEEPLRLVKDPAVEVAVRNCRGPNAYTHMNVYMHNSYGSFWLGKGGLGTIQFQWGMDWSSMPCYNVLNLSCLDALAAAAMTESAVAVPPKRPIHRMGHVFWLDSRRVLAGWHQRCSDPIAKQNLKSRFWQAILEKEGP